MPRAIRAILLSLLPMGVLLLAGWWLQQGVAMTRAASFDDLNYVTAYSHLLYALLVLTGVFAVLLALTSRLCPVPVAAALLYLAAGLGASLFMPMFLHYGREICASGVPQETMNYFLFRGREIERLSWNLLGAFGLYALLMRMLPQR